MKLVSGSLAAPLTGPFSEAETWRWWDQHLKPESSGRGLRGPWMRACWQRARQDRSGRAQTGCVVNEAAVGKWAPSALCSGPLPLCTWTGPEVFPRSPVQGEHGAREDGCSPKFSPWKETLCFPHPVANMIPWQTAQMSRNVWYGVWPDSRFCSQSRNQSKSDRRTGKVGIQNVSAELTFSRTPRCVSRAWREVRWAGGPETWWPDDSSSSLTLLQPEALVAAGAFLCGVRASAPGLSPLLALCE